MLTINQNLPRRLSTTISDFFVWSVPQNYREVLIGIIILVAQTGAVVIGGLLFTAPAVVSPAAGISLASMFLGGFAMWPAVFIGCLIGYGFSGLDPTLALILSASYTLQAVVGAFVLRKLEYDIRLSRLQDAIVLLIATLSASLIVPSVTLGAWTAISNFLPSFPPTSALLVTWGSWWIGVFFSIFMLAPFILRWSVKPHPRKAREYIESIIAFTLLMIVAIPLFWTDMNRIGEISLVYVLLAPLFWIVLRLGPRLTTLALPLLSLTAVLGLLWKEDILFQPITSFGDQIFQLQLLFIILGIIFYITVSIEEERKEKTKEFAHLVQSLQSELKDKTHEDKLRNEFIAILAHELRNPLAPVVSILELLRLKEGLTVDSKQMIKKAETQVQTMQRLLDDLLGISRLMQKKFKLKKELSSLNTLLWHSIDSTEHTIRSLNHTLVTKLDKRPAMLNVDPVRFEQIIVNLINNAAKYTDPGGRIELTSTIDDDTATITVSDNGIGIEPTRLTRIFMPFRQSHTKPREGGGLGIGLSITKQLTEMHGGTITAYSEGLGKGSTFTVKLPITYAEALPMNETSSMRDAEVSPETVEESGAAKQLRILVVDDNYAAAEGLKKLLEFRGHEIYIAKTGKEAVENSALFRPNAILLDIGLPDMSGYEVARRIRKKQPQTKIIALTGYGQDEDRMKAKESGCDYHLTKPVSLADIENVL